MGKKKRKRTLANPAFLDSYDDSHGGLVNVIIDTPKGSQNKYAFDERKRIFRLKKVLPEGMVFPYDFGFIPSTESGDGDPLDALVLMDKPTFSGCLVSSRVIGAIIGEERKNGSKVSKNDRLIAVAVESQLYGKIKDLQEIEDVFLKELEKFFVNYHEFDGKSFRIRGRCGLGEARRILNLSRR